MRWLSATEECGVGQKRNLRRKCVRAPRSDGAGFLLFRVYQSRYTHKEQYGSSAVSGHLCTVSYGLSCQCCQPRLREKRKEAPYGNTLVSNSPQTQGLLSATMRKAKMKFRVTCHSRSSGSWLAGAISGALGVPQRAARLPGRVRLNDLHVVHGAVLGVCLHHSYSIHHSYALTHSAKNGVFAVKPLGGSEGHKELAAIGVWPCIGHGENSSPREFQVRMKFIFKLLAIDRCTTSPCTSADEKPISQARIPPHSKINGPGSRADFRAQTRRQQRARQAPGEVCCNCQPRSGSKY